MKIAKVLLATVALISLLLLAGCGGSNSTQTSTVTLHGMTVTPGTATVAAGLTQQFAASGTYSDGTSKDLSASATWTSSDTTVATVSSTGLVTTKKKGTVTITAAWSSVSGTATMTVGDPQLTSITVTPGTKSLAAGLAQQFTATGAYTDASTKDISSSVTWTSSNPAVATLSATGLATSKTQGSATVTATSGTVSNTAVLTVTAPALVSISVAPGTQSLALGQTQQFTATGTYTDHSTSDMTASVAWSSSDPSVASVSATGLVTSKAQGAANITATAGSIANSVALTVNAPALVSISVAPATQSLALGQTQQFTATGTYSDNSTKDITANVTWSSSDTAVASVSATGLVTSKAAGSGTVTASSGTVTAQASLTVTAATAASVAVTPASPSVPLGSTLALKVTATLTDGTTQDVTSSATWSSSDESVATVDNTGTVTALNLGVSTVTATVGSLSSAATVTVSAAALQSINVVPAVGSVAKGESQQFAAYGVYTDNSQQDLSALVTWSSSDATIATVNAGLAQGVATGDATIMATYNSVSGGAALQVTSAVLTSLTISPYVPSVAAGGFQQFTATGLFSDGSSQDLTTGVTWSSADVTVATINSNGVAAALATGTANISGCVGAICDATQLTVTPATLVSVAVTPASASIAKGTTQQFTAVATFSDGSTQDITVGASWSSSDTNLVSINAGGLATGNNLSAGVVISATSGAITGSATLAVTDAVLQSISVTPAMPAMGLNATQQFTATGVYSDGSTQDLSGLAVWTSSDSVVATTTNTGVVTAISRGTAEIAATLGSITGSTTLTVTDAVLTQITVNNSATSSTAPASTPVIMGEHTKLTFYAWGTYSDGSVRVLAGVTWTSSNGSIVSINGNGLARSKAKSGTLTISALSSGLTGSVPVKVTSATLVSLAVTPASPSVAPGTTQQFVLTGTFSDGSTQDFTALGYWQSSSAAVATVSKGLASAVSTGTATISASYSGMSASATLTVTSATLQSIGISPANPSIVLGAAQQFSATGNFSDGTQQDLTTLVRWSSSASTVAVVNSGGLATSAGRGTTNIGATLGTVSSTTVLTVN